MPKPNLRSAVAITVSTLMALAGSAVAGVTAASAAGPAGVPVPQYDHVFTVIEENHGFEDIIGNPAAPTLNNLAQHYGLATQYYGVTHPSGPNYVAMLGGGTFGVNSDDPYWLFHVNQPSLMSQLGATGKTWKGYFQGMPYAGYRAYCHPVRCLGIPDSDTLYIAKHNGIVYFSSMNRDPRELAKMQPIAQLHRDLRSGQVPNFSYIVPDECADMHGAPPVCVDSGNPRDTNDNWLVSTADAYLARTVHEITRSPVWTRGNNAIVVVFDEGNGNAGCCGSTTGGGRALAIVVTNHGEHPLQDATPYNHYSLLSTLQHAFGLGCLAATCDGANVKPMAPLFAVPSSAPTAVVPDRLLHVREPVAGARSATVRTASPARVSAAKAGAPASGTWQVVPSPNLSQNANNLASVSAASASNAWAVGSYYTDADPNIFRNLSLHWDGSRWTAIAPPNVGVQENTLFGVSALPGGSAWAAGYYADSSFHVRTLTEHWDGSSWSVTPSENPGAARDVLFSISAVSDHDVWAVGYQESSLDGRFHTLIEHWDGQRWHTVPSPNPGTNGNELYAVAADGPSDAWAVGQQLSSSFPSRALIEHWDGRAWRVAPAPVLPDQSLDPWAAAATGGHLIAGGVKESDISPQTTLAFTAFRTTTLTPSANVGAGENDFYGMTVSPAGAWAAGRTIDPLTLNQSPLAEKRRDGQWSVVPTPNPAGTGGNAGFGGISSAPGGETWAVGAYSTAASKNRTLVERYVP